MHEPTNSDLYVQLENLRGEFISHAAEDKDVAIAQALVNKQEGESLAALHEWKETVATKKDIEEVLRFMRNVDSGVGMVKFTWNNAAKIGAFLGLLVGIFLLVKYGFVAAIAFIFRGFHV